MWTPAYPYPSGADAAPSRTARLASSTPLPSAHRLTCVLHRPLPSSIGTAPTVLPPPGCRGEAVEGADYGGGCFMKVGDGVAGMSLMWFGTPGTGIQAFQGSFSGGWATAVFTHQQGQGAHDYAVKVQPGSTNAKLYIDGVYNGGVIANSAPPAIAAAQVKVSTGLHWLY